MLKRWCLVALLLPFSLQAAEQAGKVVLSVGKNMAQLESQPPRALKRNGPVYVRDQISTSERGQLQLRLNDGSRVSLEKNTLFTLEQHAYPVDKPAEGRAVYRLIKGGLRTITGAISSAQPDNYQLHTPIATIGVRGTHYTLFYCDQACAESSARPQGLWGQVLEGTILVIVDDSEQAVSAGEYFFLEHGQQQPQVRPEPFSETGAPESSAEFGETPESPLPELDRISLPVEQDLNQIPLNPQINTEQTPLQITPGDNVLQFDPAGSPGSSNY